MESVRYMISDAANIVNVESHVLRYWEEELELNIPRNEMGHRYYTEENIAQFHKIKEWKEQGYQLKAIRMMIHSKDPDMDQEEDMEMRMGGNAGYMNREYLEPGQRQMSQRYGNPVSNTVKLEQFQSMMSAIVRRAMEENNQALSQEVGTQVGERVLKEMNYLMREQDEAEEERFRKLDEAIRSRQKGRRFGREKKEKKEKEARAKKSLGKDKSLNPNPTV